MWLIKHAFKLVDFDGKIQQNFKIETYDIQCLKDHATFAIFLVKVSPHMVVMFDEIINLVGLNAALQGMPIRLQGQSRSQFEPIC